MISLFQKILFLGTLICTSSAFSFATSIDHTIDSLEIQLDKQLRVKQKHSVAFRQNLYKIIELYSIQFDAKRASSLIKSLNVESPEWNMSERAQLYIYRAIISKYNENYTDAKYNFLKARETVYKDNNRLNKLIYFIEIAEFNRKMSNLELALKQISTALKISKQTENIPIETRIKLYNRLAAIYNENCKIPNSINYSNKAIALSKKHQRHTDLGISYNELGYTYKNLGQIDKSELYYKLSVQEFELAGCTESSIHPLYNLGLLYIHNNFKRKKGVAIMHDIENLVKKKNIKYPLNMVYDILKKEGNYTHNLKEEIKYFELYHKESLKYNAKREKSALIAVEKNFNETKLSMQKEKIKRNLIQSNLNLKNTERINFLMSAVVIFLIAIISTVIFFGIKMRRLNRKLVVQDAFNKRMMAVISHDLKGAMYLLKILGNRSLSQEGQRQSETLNRLNNQIDSSNEILDSLLKWLKTAFTKQSEHAHTSMPAVWQIVKKEFQEKLAEKGIEIILESEPNPMIDLPADVTRIAMRNMLSNAIKYSYDRSTIIVTLGNNLFKIQDFGTGIDSDRVHQLFASDVVSINGTFEESGFGIGLFMTYNLLLEHGFKISVSSIADEGTIFTISN